MKTFLILFSFITAGMVLAQDQLVSVYNSRYEIYGGMADGGISTSESYAFVAIETIELTEIYFNQKN